MFIWSKRLNTPLNVFFCRIFSKINVFIFVYRCSRNILIYFAANFRRKLDLSSSLHSVAVTWYSCSTTTQQFSYLPLLQTYLFQKLLFLINHSWTQSQTLKNFCQLAKNYPLKKCQRFYLYRSAAFENTAVAISDPQCHWFQ